MHFGVVYLETIGLEGMHDEFEQLPTTGRQPYTLRNLLQILDATAALMEHLLQVVGHSAMVMSGLCSVIIR